jgi:mono/diheme cytochrome c family protein
MTRWLAGLLSVLLASAAQAAQPVDYARDVKPLLAKHCYSCHGATQQKAKLRLDSAAAITKGEKAVIIPGKSKESLLVQAITGADGLTQMPYKKPPLSAREIALLRNWIDQGAKAPEREPAYAAAHWAFLPPRRQTPPTPPAQGGELSVWPLNAIDHFILARLEQEGLGPSPQAERATLIRRLYLDLLGLLPPISEVDAFVADQRPDAYERLVDRLLASPHYGERWGRHWLDLARYADSNGYSIDAPREIWSYRDWVINALNRDLPFDQFVIEQMAGDLLPNARTDQIVATGFHRNTQINQEGGIDPEQFRVDAVADRVATTGVVFLGLTLGCARCHDHKFDPITQREFYQLFAFLNNQDEPTLPLATPELAAKREAIQVQIRLLAEEALAYQKQWVTSLSEEERSRIPRNIEVILNLGFEQRDKKQRQTLLNFFKGRDAAMYERLLTIAELEKREPKFPTTMVLKERATPRETRVHVQGDFTRPREKVEPGVPAVLHALEAQRLRSVGLANRLDLARWLVDPANPLTARVAVNRLWQAYFGAGLVETENDFGTQGTPPTHPELLDWLATELIARRWSLKEMHRLIVTSATYRQSSVQRADLAKVDPYNRLQGRQNRLRLEAEVVRDAALTAGAKLNAKVGGPSVFPPQPEGVFRFTQVPRDWTPSTGPDRYRRGMYTYFWRSSPHPALIVFDAPNAAETCTRRVRSNTPLQALTLLNDESFHELAQALAARVLRDGPADDAGRLRFAFRLCLAREPTPVESQRLGAFLAQQVQESGSDQKTAWTALARVLLNLDEFITRE